MNKSSPVAAKSTLIVRCRNAHSATGDLTLNKCIMTIEELKGHCKRNMQNIRPYIQMEHECLFRLLSGESLQSLFDKNGVYIPLNSFMPEGHER